MAISASCTDIFDPDQLDQAPPQDLDFEKVFTDYEQFRKYVDFTYKYMPGHLGRLWNSLQCEMSDEADGPDVNSCSPAFNNGAWSAAQMTNPSTNPVANSNREIFGIWEDCYTGIRQTNQILANHNMVTNYPNNELHTRAVGEAYFIRAFLYFELVKRWGGVVIFDKPLDSGDEYDIARSSYDECVRFIVADCDTAASILDIAQPDSETGRATKGAALALKSRTLLYAARLLNNPEQDLSKWQAAADAAKAVIDLAHYDVDADYTNLFFRSDLGPEIIMNRPRKKMTFEEGHLDNGKFWVRFFAPEGYNGWASTVVSENMAAMFEAANGYPITDSRSGYTEEMLNTDPYNNRDPRFKTSLLYNDRTWGGRNMEFYDKGKDYGTTHINTLGYAIAKFWPEAHQRYQGTSTYLNYIFFRYAEILLNYAEAANEIYGPDGGELSARTAINELRIKRNHVEIPLDISSTIDEMRARIKNERAVELCFEEHRWYDVLSWHEGVKYFNADIMGMDIKKLDDGTFTYTPFVYESRIFKDHMHRYPIPNEDIYKSSGILLQNPTW